VFTIPRILRKLFYKDRKLLGKLAACAKETIEEIFNAIFRDKSYQVGVIISKNWGRWVKTSKYVQEKYIFI
jgi:hypothetical protein